MNSQKRIGLLKSIYEGLSERSIQAYFHQEDIQEAIAKLNWDGGVPTFTCGDGCYSDFVGHIEANLGVNKANYFIKRDLGLSTFITESKITRDLSITIKNEANTYLGPSGQYQTYFRIMVPQDAKILSLKLLEGPSVDELNPDITQEDGRQEVGSFIEINPQETKTVKLIWETEIPEGENINSYGLFVRKQAGTSDDLLNVKIRTPNEKVQSLPAATLTKDGASTYNTNLSRDFFARLSW